MRVWFNGRTPASQAGNGGPIPLTRFIFPGGIEADTSALESSEGGRLRMRSGSDEGEGFPSPAFNFRAGIEVLHPPVVGRPERLLKKNLFNPSFSPLFL